MPCDEVVVIGHAVILDFALLDGPGTTRRGGCHSRFPEDPWCRGMVEEGIQPARGICGEGRGGSFRGGGVGGLTRNTGEFAEWGGSGVHLQFFVLGCWNW